MPDVFEQYRQDQAALRGEAPPDRLDRVDPNVVVVGGPPDSQSVFGDLTDAAEREALSGEQPMREARVKVKKVDPQTGAETYDDEVQYGFDMRAQRNRLARVLLRNEVAKRQAALPPGTTLPAEEVTALGSVMQEEAQSRLMRHIQRTNNENFLFIDDDSDGTTARIAETGGLPEPVANVVRAALPTFLEKKVLGTTGLVAAWLEGRGGRTYKPRYDEATDTWVTEEAELAKREGALGKLEFITQPAPSTYFATAMAAGFDLEAAGSVELSNLPVIRQIQAYVAGEQTPEQIARVRNGEDMFTFAGEIGAFVSPYTDDPEGVFANLVGGATAFGVAMVEPDLFSALTFGVGKLARGVKGVQRTGEVMGKVLPMADKWSLAGKADRVVKTAATWAARIDEAVDAGMDPEDLAKLEKQAAQAIHDINPHLNFLLQSRLRALTAMRETGDPRVENAVLYALTQRKLAAQGRVDELPGQAFIVNYLRKRQTTMGAAEAADKARQSILDLTQQTLPPWAGTLLDVSARFAGARLKRAAAEEALAVARQSKTTTPFQLKQLENAVGRLEATEARWTHRRKTLLSHLDPAAADDYRNAEHAWFKTDRSAAAALDAAQNYADEAVLQHLKAMREGLSRVVQQRPKAVNPADAQVLSTEFMDSIVRYGNAQKALIHATDPAALVAAQEELYKASLAMRKVTLMGADAVSSQGYKVLDDAIDIAETASKDSAERLARGVRLAEAAGIKVNLAGHKRAIDGLLSAERRATRERLLARAISDSLRNAAKQYGRYGDLLRGDEFVKVDMTKASRAVGSVLDAAGKAEPSALLRVVEDIFGSDTVDLLLKADSIPVRLAPFVDALKVAKAGATGAVQLSRAGIHDLVTSLRSVRNAAHMAGAEEAISTELRRLTMAGLDELVGPPVPAAAEAMEKTLASLLQAGDMAATVAGVVLKSHLERVMGTDAVEALIGIVRRADDAGLTLDPQRYSKELVDTIRALNAPGGMVATDKALTELVTAITREKKLIVEASTQEAAKRKLIPRLRNLWRMLQRTKLILLNPAAAKLGYLFDNENLLQIGKGVIDHSKLTQREIVEVMSRAATPGERANAAMRYVTDASASFGDFRAVGHAVLGNKSLWEGAALLWKGMSKAELEADDLLEGLSRIWIKDGTVDPGKGHAMLKGLAVKMILEAKHVLNADGVRVVDLDFATFTRKLLEKTVELEQKEQLVSRVARHFDSEQVRAYGYAAQLVGAAASVQRAVDSMSLRMVGVTPEVISNVRKLLANQEDRITGGYDELYALFARLGLPPKHLEQAAAIGKKIERGIMQVQDSDGALGAFPYEWHHHIVKEMEPLIKRWVEASDKTRDTLPPVIHEFIGTLGRIWRTSVTSGIFLLSPRYLATNTFGLISQIGLEADFGAALKAVAQGSGLAAMESWPVLQARKWFPGQMGKLIDEPYLKALQGSATRPQGLLPSIVHAVFNPCVAAIYDTQRFADDVVLPSSGKHTVTMGQLRSWLAQEGVLTSQASENMMEIISRATKLSIESRKWTMPWFAGEVARAARAGGATGGTAGAVKGAAGRAGGIAFDAATHPFKTVDERGQIIAGLADAVEQRQRAALFTELVVNRGMHPEDAGRIVREAAYDWNHASVEDEAKMLGPFILFWRAMKLMYRQGVRHALDPFMRAFETPGAGGAKVVGGSISKLRALEGVTERAGVVMQERSDQDLDYEDFAHLENGTPEERAEFEELLEQWRMQSTSPWWMASGMRQWMGTTPMPPDQREASKQARGKELTHLATTFPSHTVLEFVGHIFASGVGLANLVTGETSGIDATRAVAIEFAQAGGPVAGEALEQVVDTFLGTEPGAYRPKTFTPVKLRPQEAILAEHFPDMMHAVPDGEGGWLVPQWVATVLRMIPVLGTEVFNYAQPAVDIAVGMTDPGAAAGVSYYLRQVSGLGRTYPFNPVKELENKSKYALPALTSEMESGAGGKEEVDAFLARTPGVSIPEGSAASKDSRGRPKRPTRSRPKRPRRDETPK